VREKIIGEDTLRHINMLERALIASRSVVRIGVSGSAGTGFMVAPDLVMTKAYCQARTCCIVAFAQTLG